MAEKMEPTDIERTARTLNLLVRLFDKLTEIDDRVRTTNKRNESGRDADNRTGKGDDAERLRKDLASRTSRLSE